MRMVQRHGTPFLLLFAGIAIGFFLSAHWVPNVSAVGRQDYESLEAFSNILSIVKKNYVEDVETKNLVNGAINGMLNSLDPHSAYLTPDLYKELQSDTQGRFGGLGIEITVKGGILTVVSPIEDTPAAKAGIQPGDQIFKIEDEFTKDMSHGRRGQEDARSQGNQNQLDDQARRRHRSGRVHLGARHHSGAECAQPES